METKGEKKVRNGVRREGGNGNYKDDEQIKKQKGQYRQGREREREVAHHENKFQCVEHMLKLGCHWIGRKLLMLLQSLFSNILKLNTCDWKNNALVNKVIVLSQKWQI